MGLPAHHVLPLAESDFFLKRGMDPNEYGLWVSPKKHTIWHGVKENNSPYNLRWKNWINANQNATRAEVEAKLRAILLEYPPEKQVFLEKLDPFIPPGSRL